LIAISTIPRSRETTVGSLADEMDIDIEVRRRGSGYILIAYRFGVVVRSKELQSGIEDLERRVAAIGQDLREVGPPVTSTAVATAKKEMWILDQLKPWLIALVTVAAVLTGLVLLVTAPLISALANVRSGISALVPIQEGSSIAATGRVGIDFIIKLGQTMDQITPQRKEELRTAIRKIAREVDSIIEDAKSAQPPSPASPPRGGKR
jgi:hypothetical protein